MKCPQCKGQVSRPQPTLFPNLLQCENGDCNWVSDAQTFSFAIEEFRQACEELWDAINDLIFNKDEMCVCGFIYSKHYRKDPGGTISWALCNCHEFRPRGEK